MTRFTLCAFFFLQYLVNSLSIFSVSTKVQFFHESLLLLQLVWHHIWTFSELADHIAPEFTLKSLKMNRRRAVVCLFLLQEKKSCERVHAVNQKRNHFSKSHLLFLEWKDYPDRFCACYDMNVWKFHEMLGMVYWRNIETWFYMPEKCFNRGETRSLS